MCNFYQLASVWGGGGYSRKKGQLFCSSFAVTFGTKKMSFFKWPFFFDTVYV